MGTAVAENIRTKNYRTNVQTANIAPSQTFQEWLEEEAKSGKVILAARTGKPYLPARPSETVDFWSVYDEVRSDRF